MSIERIKAIIATGSAERDLRRYIADYDGARFDKADGQHATDEFTTEDFKAVQALNVNVLHTARSWLLGEGKAQVGDLLRRIPADLDIWDVQPTGYAAALGPGSPAWQLWQILYDLQQGARRAGRGVTAGKLLHRKRPRLIPIFDHAGIGQVLSVQHKDVWKVFWCALRQPDIRQQLTELQAKVSEAENLSLLRVLDIIAWMSPRKEIAFAVRGWPPKKSEAKSLLAAGHPHESLVRDLLTAAQGAAQRSGWGTCTSEVALALTIRGPRRPPGDATNFLGGVADVLQDKTKHRNFSLDHLGPLRDVALFADDGQISRISYREEPAETPSYSVRISSLANPDAADIMGWH